MEQIKIGIDPDSQNFGVCKFRDKKEFTLHAFDLFELFDFAKENRNCLFVIEDIFKGKKIFAPKNAFKSQVAKENYLVSRANALGKCQQNANILIEFLKINEISYVMSPVQKGLKKIDAKAFMELTGVKTLQKEQDKRDAYFIAKNYIHFVKFTTTVEKLT
jgi:hypothetical protein